MRRENRGFTLIELMIVVVIIGILAAIAVPAFNMMQNRAKEGGTKANMHTFQLSAEDYGVQHEGVYADVAADPAALLPANFKNPFDNSVGDGQAWKDQPTFSSTMGTGSSISGIVAYSDSLGNRYCIAGHGATALLQLHLSSGQ